MGWTVRSSISLLSKTFRPDLGTTQRPLHWVLRVLSSGVKPPERAADHSPPSSAEVKNEWGSTSTPPPVRLHGVVRDKFYIYFMIETIPPIPWTSIGRTEWNVRLNIESVHSCVAAQRPMTAPALLYSVPCQRGTEHRRADDINCCTATDDVPALPYSFPR